MSMITATAWVPRGAAATSPTKYDVDETELSRISQLARLQLEDAKTDLDNVKKDGTNNTTTEDSSDDEDIGVQLPKTNGSAIHWLVECSLGV